MFSGVHPLDHMRLMREVEELKTAFGNALRVGPVHEVDARLGYRLNFGEDSDGEPWLSPWIAHPETGKTSVPLKVGQLVGLLAPHGDMRQGMLLRDGYGGEHKSPNEDMKANVFADAGVTVRIAEEAVVIGIGSASFTLSAAGLAIALSGAAFELTEGGFRQTGGAMEHDGRNVGSSHVHGGVARGAATTNGPQ